MKKKILVCLMMLVCIVTLTAGIHAAEVVYQEISTPAQLKKLMDATDAATLGKNYKLTADIDMSGYTAAQQSSIGDVNIAFTGQFNGDGHMIMGINISTTAKRTGLFGWVSGATIENLTVYGNVTSSLDGVGGVVGCAGLEAGKTTTIRNVVNYCTVTCTRASDTARVGGILGVFAANNLKNVNLVVENCVNYGAISGYKHIGGVIGRFDDVGTTATGTATVTGCANFGTVAMTKTNVNADGAGGIIGTILPRNSTYTIKNCYNSGAVTGGYRLGGIVGSVATYTGTTGKAIISDCVNVGDVTSTYTGSEGAIGGVLGEVFNSGAGSVTIANCFANGVLTSVRTDKGANTGAILGRGTDHKGALTYSNNGNCYASTMKFVTTGTGTANKTGGVAVSNLASASAYPATFNADGVFLFSDKGPFLKAVHEHLIQLNTTAKTCICSLCEEKLLTVTEKDGELWINLSASADLLLLMANSKAGNADALGYNYILTQSIDLKNHPAQYPIGQPTKSASSAVPELFTGKFDGNNKTISGLQLSGSLSGYGLFGSVGGGTTGGNDITVIKNVSVEGKVESTASSSFVGGVVGLVYGNATIENCVNNCTVSGVSRVGGVVGSVVYNVTALDGYTYTATIKNCVNNGAVSASTTGESRLGGVVGQVSMGGRTDCEATIENCTNNGTVTGVGNYVGGITSRLEPNASEVSAINCVNGESATVTGVNYVGGIAGITYYSANTTGAATVSGCINYGTVNADGLVGGIVGYAYAAFCATYIKDCLNVGPVTGTYRVGGINGYTHTYRKANTSYASTPLNIYVENCVNIGTITATGKDGSAEAAGISAISNVASFSNCINVGKIVGTGKYIAGISANAVNASFKDCVSAGTIVSNTQNAEGVYAIVGNKQSGCMFTGCGYKTGTLADAGTSYASEITAADTFKLLALWCIYHGPKSDAADISKSAHLLGTDNKCIVCGAAAHTAHSSTAAFVEDEEIRIDATCKADGTKFLFCEKCYVAKTETIPKAHLFEWNLTDLDFGCRTCDDDFEQNISVAEAKNLTTIYVSDNGVAGNNGADAAHPLDSFTTAMDVAAALGNAYGHAMTVKIVDVATLAFRQYSEANTHTVNFEEPKHNYPITITSADVDNKGTLRFSNEAYYYFLYGDTTFENMQFGAVETRIGTNSSESQASNIFARGFSLVLGEGLVMLSNSEDIKLSKTNTGVDGLGATVNIPDVKLYVFGGFQLNGFYDGDAGKNNVAARKADSNLTVLSGKYWTIAGANRGSNMNTYPGTSGLTKTVNITLGAVETAYVCPLTSDTANAQSVVVNIHYTDTYKAAYDYRLMFNADSYGASATVNRFYHKEAAGSQVGDFSMGKAVADSKINFNINMYYAPEMSGEKIVKGYTSKHVVYAKEANQTGDVLSLPEWCVKYGVNGDGEHDFVEGVCSFCGITKCTGSNHYVSWDVATGVGTCIAGETVSGTKSCTKTFNISANSAIYVSDSGKAGATGLSKTDPINSFVMAMDLAAKAGKDFTVYLVGTVTPSVRQIDRAYNEFANSFEETKHTNTITVTSVSSSNKGTLHFTNNCRRYFMYGPTTFKNIEISCDVTNGIYLFARGHKLVIDTGVTMVDVKGKTTSEKTNAGITGLGATVQTSDVKMYVYGGFYAETDKDENDVEYIKTKGLYPGADPESYTADVTVKSGTYWTICGLNRGFMDTQTMENATVKMALQNVSAYVVCPTTTDAAKLKSVDAEVHYTGKINTAFTYRFTYSANSVSVDGGANSVDHFFYKGYNGSTVGDFGVGSDKVKTDVNMYYATALAENGVVLGFIEKSDRYAAAYGNTVEILSFPEYCTKYLGGHTYNANNVCTFCDTMQCVAHSGTEWVVTVEPTCVSAGTEELRCTACLEAIETKELAKLADGHDLVWTYGDTEAVCTCNNGCDYRVTKAYDKNATEIHVSSKGSADGDMTATAPLNDFSVAMQFAAKSDKDVTVYIHDVAMIYENGPITTWNEYIEPEHDNTITISGYNGNSGILRFYNPNKGMVMVYNLSGDVIFQNLELSSGDGTSRMYIAARHNKLVFGENVTADWQRNLNQSLAGSDIIVIGGCYGARISDDCTGLGTDVTLLSGNVGAVVGGSYLNANCCAAGSTINLTLGDVAVRRDIAAGSYGDSSNATHSGDINITIKGNVSVGENFSFAPIGKSKEGVKYTAQNVTVKILDGSVVNGNFTATDKMMSSLAVGAAEADETPLDRLAKLTVYVDKNNPKAVAIFNYVYSATLVADPADVAAKFTYDYLGETYCDVNGEHTPAGAGTVLIPATCLSEGLAEYTCTTAGCLKTYTMEIPATGHDFTGVVAESIAATCAAPAMEKKVCNNCQATVYTATGDAPLDASVYANHTDPEKTGFCQICNKDITKLCNHTVVETENITAGCATGKKITCTECGMTEVKIASTNGGHNFGAYTVMTEPTATTAGVKTRTCKGCGKVETAVINASGDAINAGALATDANGNLADFGVAASKLSKVEKKALDALLQKDAYGSEVKVSYETDGDVVTNVTYRIPVPAEYTKYENVMIVVKDEGGNLHFVDFKVEKGYIVFEF